jgi:hypothetical protein
MRYIVTHQAPDLDAITSVWLLKRFLPDWQHAELKFVPAGMRKEGAYEHKGEAVEIIDGHETVHVDTGLGPLDHHQTQDRETCAAKLTFDFVKADPANLLTQNPHKTEAVARMVDLVIDDDQFQDVFQPVPAADLYEFSLAGIIDGFKRRFPGEDQKCADFLMECLDDILHDFESRIWAEEEIREKGVEFNTKWGKALGVESQNDDVLKLAQKMGYVIVLRKDPSNGKLRIKARPMKRAQFGNTDYKTMEEIDIDLTPAYDKLLILDPHASWFLHVSKRMLLNGSSKNPTMKGTQVTLDQAIEVLKNL